VKGDHRYFESKPRSHRHQRNDQEFELNGFGMGLNKNCYFDNVKTSGGPVDKGESVEEKRGPKGAQQKILQGGFSAFQLILDFAVQNTSLKAAALSLGKGNEAIKRFERALKNLMQSSLPGDTCSQVAIPAFDTLVAGLRIECLHAPHIAAASDARMDEMEAEMRQDGEIVDASLNKLTNLVPEEDRASLQDARQAYDEFAAVTAEVIKLSRENTNIKSFELSFGKWGYKIKRERYVCVGR
jgi:hypothetical protein